MNRLITAHWSPNRERLEFEHLLQQQSKRLLHEHQVNEQRRREHNLRRITLRVNDGNNQCLPPSAWMTLADRLANRATDKIMDRIAAFHIGLVA